MRAGTSGGTRSWGTIRLVAGREIKERLHGRLTYVMTAVTTVVVVAAIVIPALVHGSPKPTAIGLTGAGAQALRPALEAAASAQGVTLRIEDIEAAAARAQVVKGTLAVAVSAGDGSLTLVVKRDLPPPLAALVRGAANRVHQRQVLAGAGVAPETTASAEQPVAIAVQVLRPARPGQQARTGAAIAAAVLLYISLLTYGSSVAIGVAQEKTSRAAEVLLASVRSTDLVSGKVAGIGICGLGQLTVTVLAGLIANTFAHQAQVSSIVVTLLPGILLWFLLGYTFYSFAFAAAGSLVARQEDVQTVIAPFSFILVGAYVLTFAAVQAPDAAWVRALSLLPPLAPVLMPARIALGHLALWETPVAVMLMLASAYGMARLGAGIYARALMRGGSRLGWRAALTLRSATPR